MSSSLVACPDVIGELLRSAARLDVECSFARERGLHHEAVHLANRRDGLVHDAQELDPHELVAPGHWRSFRIF